MLKHSIKISLLLVFLSIAAGCLLILKPEILSAHVVSFSAVFLIGLISWAYIIIRVFIFRRNLTRFFNYMLKGDYEIGIKAVGILDDEINHLVKLINKSAEQLRHYDKMRAEKVKFNFITIDALYKNSKEAIVAADTQKGFFQLNPAAQAIFGIKQDNYTFGAVEKIKENEDFIALFKKVADEEKIPKEGSIKLKMPGSDSEKEIVIKMIPVKDDYERVKLVLIYVNKGGLMAKLHINI